MGNPLESSTKILKDLIDKDLIEAKAIVNWQMLPSIKKKQKSYKYNQVLTNQWRVDSTKNWSCKYIDLTVEQKRLLLKKELINTYNALSEDDKLLLEQYLNLDKAAKEWVSLSSDDKKKLIQLIF